MRVMVNHGRGMCGMDIDGKWRTAAETMVGWGLFTLPFWSHLADGIIKGGQVVASLTGGIIGVVGVYRLFFRKRRRRFDNP